MIAAWEKEKGFQLDGFPLQKTSSNSANKQSFLILWKDEYEFQIQNSQNPKFLLAVVLKQGRLTLTAI